MVTLWPYARWDDPRLKIAQDFLSVNAVTGAGEFKAGDDQSHRLGWLPSTGHLSL